MTEVQPSPRSSGKSGCGRSTAPVASHS